MNSKQPHRPQDDDLPLLFRTRLCSISTDAPSITSLSDLMRNTTDLIRQKMLQTWVAVVDEMTDPTKLLALVYLANDVIQLLRGSETDLIFRYNFAPPFAQSIVAIRERAPELLPKMHRILSIFKNRVVFDSLVLKLLQRVLEDDLDIVLNHVIPMLKTETNTLHLNERLQQLEKETQVKQQQQQQQQQQQLPQQQQQQQQQPAQFEAHPSTDIQRRHQKPPQLLASPAELHPRVISAPTLDDLIHAGHRLEMLCCRPRRQECLNLDAASLPHFRGHRVLPNARISATDSNLIECYKVLLNSHKVRVADIHEKIARRKKEEEKGQFLLMLNRNTQSAAASSAKRVEVLMKKELNTRLQKMETENAIYWKLVEMLEYLGSRWQRIQSIVQRVETESERRSRATCD